MIATSRRRMLARLNVSTALLSSTALAAMVLGTPGTARALDATALPTGGTVVGGSATIGLDPSASNKLDINQTSNRTVINWNSFNIGANATTQFYQPNSSSLAVNRVTGPGNDPSKIEGSLVANGKVMVIDQNGVIFGKTAVINVNGIIASTGDVDTAAVMRGDTNLAIGNFGDGKIVNNGTINAGNAGLVAFVGKNVANNGTINATLGSVALAATGTTATIDLTGDGLIALAPGGATGKVLAQNAGTINAQGGHVAITAAAAKDAVDNVVNMSGVVDVSSVTSKGGDIVLSGGDTGGVDVSGALNASGKTGGGAIKVTGKNVEVGSGALLDADAGVTGDGGTVEIKAAGNTQFDGIILARGGAESGNGGSVEISGATLGYTGFVDTLAPHGATGILLLDPADMLIGHAPSDFGSLDAPYVNDQDVANALEYNNVDLKADTSITVVDNVDFGTWVNDFLPAASFVKISPLAASILPIEPAQDGITTNALTLTAPTVNLDHNVTLGTGGLTVDATTLNLGGQILQRDAVNGPTSLASASQLDSTAGAINIESNSALIGQGLQFAESGATVNVAAGTYDEDLTMNKTGVTLSGAGGQLTHLTPHSPGVVVTADNDTVEGMYITGATNGVYVENASGVKILNNDIEQTSGNGILASGSDDLTIQGNTIKNTASPSYDSGSGIYILGGNGATIGGATAALGNTVSQSGWDNIKVSGTTNALIENNMLDTPNRTNVYALNSTGTQILNNNGEHANLAGAGAIWVSGGSGATVSNNTVGDAIANGIQLNNVTGANTVSGNKINNSGAIGIDVYKVSALTAKGNNVQGGTVGYDVDHSDDALFADNVAEHQSGDGFQVNNGAGDTLHDNRVDKVGGDGFDIVHGTGVTLDHNGIYLTGNNGIEASNSNFFAISDNFIGSGVNGLSKGNDNISGDGMLITNSSNGTITGNTVQQTKSTADDVGSGIYLIDGKNDVISGNTISASGWDNIKLVGTTNDTVIGNTLSSPKRVNVYADNTTHTQIENNTDTGAMLKGAGAIWVDGGSHATVTGNTITNARYDGISINDATGPNLIDGNTIDTVGKHGIEATGAGDVTITNNKIGLAGPGSIGKDGIYAVGLTGTTVIGGNQIANTGNDGIYVDPSQTTTISNNTIVNANGDGIDAVDIDGLTIAGNTIEGSGLNGIEVSGGSDVAVTNNTVTHSGADGIYVHDIGDDEIFFTELVAGDDSPAADAVISGNTVDFTGDNGIEVGNVDTSLIQNNKVGTAGPGDGDGDNIGADGIDVYGFGEEASDVRIGLEIFPFPFNEGSTTITGNTVANAGAEGIEVDNLATADIETNTVDNVRDNGIYAFNIGQEEFAAAFVDPSTLPSGDLTINGNMIGQTGTISANGIYVDDSASTVIANNTIGTSARTVAANGIDVEDNSDDVTIAGNTVTGAGANGIYLSDVDGVAVSSNLITSSGANGLFLAGPDNGYVSLAGNVFTDNPTGAEFQSGIIDLTGASNTFNGGRTGLLFSPYVIDGGEGDGDGALDITYAPLSLVSNDPDGFPDGTIGTTIFNGQTVNYVDFENGAFYEPGEPSIIDGLNASYDGFVPATTGGVENNAQYDAIENLIHHYPDDNSLGLLFFGFVEGSDLVNLNLADLQGDIYERISGYQVGPHAFRVTVTGLPRTGVDSQGGGNTGGTGNGTGGNSLGTSADLLANVQPAAGGSQNQATQAAAIEPAAGGADNGNGKTSRCWSQTISNAAAGITTSFTFGGTPEANLTGISTCGG